MTADKDWAVALADLLDMLAALGLKSAENTFAGKRDLDRFELMLWWQNYRKGQYDSED